jgi:hypothetical protein
LGKKVRAVQDTALEKAKVAQQTADQALKTLRVPWHNKKKSKQLTGGTQKVKLGHKDDGFAILAAVYGKFEGGGEGAEVFIDKDDHWYLSVTSHAKKGFVKASAYFVGRPK